MAGIQTSMGAHKLELRQGNIHTPCDGVGALASAVLNDPDVLASVVAGACMSKNAGGFLVPGILPTITSDGGPSPLFLWFGNDENTAPAVRRDRGMPQFGSLPADGNDFWQIPETGDGEESGPYNYIIGQAGGVTLTSTRFNSDVGYEFGTPLTAISAAAAAGIRGIIQPAVGDNVVIGFAQGVMVSPDGYDTLIFNPTYIPGDDVPTTLAT